MSTGTNKDVKIAGTIRRGPSGKHGALEPEFIQMADSQMFPPAILTQMPTPAPGVLHLSLPFLLLFVFFFKILFFI